MVTKKDKAVKAPFASVYGLLVALGHAPPIVLSPLVAVGRPVVEAELARVAGKDVPRSTGPEIYIDGKKVNP